VQSTQNGLDNAELGKSARSQEVSFCALSM
jgi:hypothetical protein